VAHTCTLSYSGGRDQEDGGLKPARANCSQDSILKKTFKERLVEWLKAWALGSNPSSTHTKKELPKA
jgi:hypothetical protein